MLWRKDNNEIGAIIDFQMIFIGSAAFDIIRILTLGLPREIRKQKTEEYLEYYHKTLSDFFQGSAPFSLDQLHNQYSLIYPFASNFTLFGISLYIKMYSDGTLGKKESKEENRKELVDRARGIVEDIEASKDH
uniref:CHK domain-containing protein n=2 Tax=Caenorhabditis tropicalis TaxID=1561998 RepID=A0A1I7U2L8_9PELO